MSTGKLFHFTQSGLDNVWLANGWRVAKTPYGPSFTIERLDDYLVGILPRHDATGTLGHAGGKQVGW